MRILLLASALIATAPVAAAMPAGDGGAVHVLAAQVAAALPAAHAAGLAIASPAEDATDPASHNAVQDAAAAAAWDTRMVRSCVRVGNRAIC